MRTSADIKQFIVDEFIPGGRIDDVADDLDLVANGIIDSLGVLNLISALENDHGLRIAPEDMAIENFATVSRIASFIEGRTAAHTA